MHIAGNSGCSVEVLDSGLVRKSASGTYANRLRRQIDKQQAFAQSHIAGPIRSPGIISTADTSDGFYAEMQFVRARDFVQFLTEADRPGLNRFADTITGFVLGNISASPERDVIDPVMEKLSELAGRKVPGKYIDVARSLCGNSLVVPVGFCHGDLTLSNILFRNESLVLIDFLDSFVESPLQDMVKLRQDTFFGWSLNMYSAEFDRTRILIALRYLDERIEIAFSKVEAYVRHYIVFQLINLMRILPYCSTSVTTDHVLYSLNRLLDARANGPR